MVLELSVVSAGFSYCDGLHIAARAKWREFTVLSISRGLLQAESPEGGLAGSNGEGGISSDLYLFERAENT